MNEAPRQTFAYDQVAYPTPILIVPTPDYLAAAAALQGLEPPDAAAPRVLEIGCGNGYNLLGMAAVAPRGTFVGFDLAGAAVEAGRALADAAALRNVRLEQGDILTWPRDGETYDFIFCHGVYSWVPPPVRAALLDLIGKRLAPGGLAYVSYDALPASAQKAGINRLLRRRTAHINDSGQQIDLALLLINLMKANQREDSRLAIVLDELMEDAHRFQRGYFFHDWLAEFYDPVSVVDFAIAAGRAGLLFAGDSRLRDLYENDLDDNGRQLVAAAGDDRVARNMTLDMLRGSHPFRQDILVRADAPPAQRADGLERLWFGFSGTREEAELDGRRAIRYRYGGDQHSTITDPRRIAILDALVDQAPGLLDYETLRRRSGASAEFAALLRRCIITSAVEIHATPPPFVIAPGERPRASRLLQVMAGGAPMGISLRHRSLGFDSPITRLLLTLADGSRTRAQIAEAMSATLGEHVDEAKVAGAVSHFAASGVFEA